MNVGKILFLSSVILGVVFIILLLTVFSSNAYACQCIGDMPIEQKVIASDIIFSGKLLEKYENSNHKGFIFEIDKLYKNHSDKILLEQKNITIFSNLFGSACGVDFNIGLDYLVYSEMKGEHAVTSLCSGSDLLFLKNSDIKHFEENDIQGQEYYEKEHPLIPGSIAKMERDCRDGLLDKQASVIRNGTHYYSKETCQWLDLENYLDCRTGTVLTNGVCKIIDNGCEPDMYGNVYCDELAEDRLTLNRVFLIEESMGFGSGTAIFDKSGFTFFTIIIAIIIGFGAFFGSIIFLRKRK